MKKAEDLKKEFIEAIDSSIEEHIKMLNQLVGQLYSGIVRDEIAKLRVLRFSILNPEI